MNWSLPFFGSRKESKDTPWQQSGERRLQLGRAADHAPITGVPPFQVGHAQSVGLVRTHNEDALVALTGTLAAAGNAADFGLFLVADGMGGHSQGERASAIAAQSVARVIGAHVFSGLMEETLDGTETEEFERLMETALRNCNTNVAAAVPAGGTTVTAALLVGGHAIVGHVGDSRAYLIEANDLSQLTADHSLVQRLQDLGEITAVQAESHPQRNVLLRAVGQGDGLQMDVTAHAVRSGARLLLCSDGLWGLLDDAQMREIISRSVDVQSACEHLVEAGNRAGGPDNITAFLVQYNHNSNDLL